MLKELAFSPGHTMEPIIKVADLVQPGADVQLLVDDITAAQRAHRVLDNVLHCVDADCRASWTGAQLGCTDGFMQATAEGHKAF